MRTAQELSTARRRLGLTLADIATNTSIHLEYLAAIEDAEPAGLPPIALLEWMLPVYAAELGLDGAELTRRYVAELRDVAAVSQSDAPSADGTSENEAAFDLPLNVTAPHYGEAVSGLRPGDSIGRPRWHWSAPTAVIVGFVTGALGTAAFLSGTPDVPSLTPQRTHLTATGRAEPPPRATGDSTEPADAVDLSGSWVVTNRVESTTYRAFRNLSIQYQLRFTHDGHRIVGTGRKWVENGKLLPVSRQTPIALEGTLTGSRLDLRFTESGVRRTSGGVFVMHVVDERTLRGSFASDAANSRGRSVGLRDTARSQ